MVLADGSQNYQYMLFWFILILIYVKFKSFCQLIKYYCLIKYHNNKLLAVILLYQAREVKPMFHEILNFELLGLI